MLEIQMFLVIQNFRSPTKLRLYKKKNPEKHYLCGMLLEVKGLHFAHHPTQKLFQNLHLKVDQGKIIALAGAAANSKGVDAMDGSEAAVSAGQQLVQQYGAHVVISGETDIIIGENREVRLNNGHAMMPFVTGMGCTLSALTGAFAAVGEMSGAAAAAVMGVAGEQAASISPGPGSLQLNLLDTLYRLDAETLENHLSIEVTTA